jgi:REP element-mobilizing transposase RayT
MSKVTAYYHIVFCTKYREMTLPLDYCDDVYRFIWSELKKMKCDLLRIGGIQNHIHMLINLHPSVSLSVLMQNIKGRSSGWIRTNEHFIQFRGWAADYYACTIAPEQKYRVIEYIKSQHTHHLGNAVDQELISMYQYAELQYDQRDLQ